MIRVLLPELIHAAQRQLNINPGVWGQAMGLKFTLSAHEAFHWPMFFVIGSNSLEKWTIPCQD